MQNANQDEFPGYGSSKLVLQLVRLDYIGTVASGNEANGSLAHAKIIAWFGMVLLGSVHAAMAEKIEANCTGMIDFDIYTIDTEEPIQDIALIGTSNVAIDDEFIILTGDFGEYKFDLNRGTLYRDGSDTASIAHIPASPGRPRVPHGRQPPRNQSIILDTGSSSFGLLLSNSRMAWMAMKEWGRNPMPCN